MIRLVEGAGKPEQSASAFMVVFEYPDRNKAQAVAHDLTNMFIEQSSATASSPALAVLDPADLPADPVTPRRSRILIMGAIGGLLLGVLALGVRRWPLVAACGILGAALTWASSLLVPSRFASTAILVAPDTDSARRASKALTDPAYLRWAIEKLKLYPAERATQPIDEVVQEMRNRAIRIQILQTPTVGHRHRTMLISYTSRVCRVEDWRGTP
jgi:hypothetical protein